MLSMARWASGQWAPRRRGLVQDDRRAAHLVQRQCQQEVTAADATVQRRVGGQLRDDVFRSLGDSG